MDEILINKISTVLHEAIILFNRKKTTPAKELLYQVLEKDPTNPEAHYYLGLIYSKDENWQKAVVHFKTVVDLSANFLYTQQCRMILGLIYFKNQEYKRAEYEYQEVLKAKVNIVQVYNALAAIKYYLDDRLEAIRYAKKACENDPYNLSAKNTYAYLLCEYNIDSEKGLEILKEVVRIKPDNPAYLDSLGWAYYKNGNRSAAINTLKKALVFSNENPEIKSHLMNVYQTN